MKAKQSSKAGTGCATIIVLFIVVAVLAGVYDRKSRETEAQSPSQPAPIDLSNAKALDDRYDADAMVHCSAGADDYLRSIAKYDVKWDEMGFFDTKFDKYLSHVVSPGVLTQVSEKAKLQNGFGAYQHVKLFCDYDTQLQKVIAYRVQSH